MSSANPYRVPQSNVDYQGFDDYSEINVFSPRGRIGRLRYLGYTMGYSTLIYIVFGIVAGMMTAAGLPNGVFLAITGIGYVLVLVLSIILTIQRAHDFNSSGWVALLAFIPILNLLFLFTPGTDGENRFGKKTAPNPGWLAWVVIIPFALVIIGIVAAIAIPAYQAYAHKAQINAQGTMTVPADQTK